MCFLWNKVTRLACRLVWPWSTAHLMCKLLLLATFPCFCMWFAHRNISTQVASIPYNTVKYRIELQYIHKDFVHSECTAEETVPVFSINYSPKVCVYVTMISLILNAKWVGLIFGKALQKLLPHQSHGWWRLIIKMIWLNSVYRESFY